jgi:AcrR family transcriptional regulator
VPPPPPLPSRTTARVDARARLVEVALRVLEEYGPDALQARTLTAEVGSSTQAIYTLFGGMPGLFATVVSEGFDRLTEHIQAQPETDDPVADHFTRGWAYCDWALAHPQLYRLMFAGSDDLDDNPGGAAVAFRLRPSQAGAVRPGAPRQSGGRAAGRAANRARQEAGRASTETALDVLVRSVQRMCDAGRMRPIDPVAAAGQFLSATHGYILLAIAGVFGADSYGLEILAALALNLMVGLGDDRPAAECSLAAAAAARAVPPRR